MPRVAGCGSATTSRRHGLDRVLEHDPGDLTCTVEAGVRLSELRATLAAAGQRLSLDPPGDPTIGALLATQRLRPAPPPLRRAARPRPRRDARARGRDDRERGRQGREERRRLRPRASRVRLRGPPRVHRARELPAAPAAEGVADARRRDARTRRRRRGALLRLAARSRARSTSSIRGASPCCSRDRSARSRPSWTTARTLVGGAEADMAVWDESRERQGAASGRVRFDPGDLGRVLEALDEAVIRPSAGVAYTRRRAQVTICYKRRPSGVEKLVERIRRELDPRGVLSGDPRVHLGLRPLRVLPADVPDVRALARGDGLAARPHPPHGRAPRRHDRAERDRRAALRPLPRLHGVRLLVPVGRALRPTDREHARSRRGGARPPARRPSRPRASLPPPPVPRPHARRAPARAARTRRADAEALPAPRRDRATLARPRRRSGAHARLGPRRVRASASSRAASRAPSSRT